MPPFTFQSKAAVVFFLLFFYRVSAYQCCRLFRPPEGAADDIERERKTGQRFFTWKTRALGLNITPSRPAGKA